MSEPYKRRLREFTEGHVSIQYAYCEAERENRQLREVCYDMWMLMQIGAVLDSVNEDSHSSGALTVDMFEHRLRELGVIE